MANKEPGRHGPPCLTLECLTCGMQAQIIARELWVEASFGLTPAHVALVQAFREIHAGHEITECTTVIELDDDPTLEPAQ